MLSEITFALCPGGTTGLVPEIHTHDDIKKVRWTSGPRIYTNFVHYTDASSPRSPARTSRSSGFGRWKRIDETQIQSRRFPSEFGPFRCNQFVFSIDYWCSIVAERCRFNMFNVIAKSPDRKKKKSLASPWGRPFLIRIIFDRLRRHCLVLNQ